MINFATLTSSNTVTFNLFNLGFNHHKVFVRLNAFSTCSGASSSLVFTVAGTPKTIPSVTVQLVYESVLIVHTASTLTLRIAFGIVG